MKKLYDIKELDHRDLFIYSFIRFSENLPDKNGLGFERVNYKLSEFIGMADKFGITEYGLYVSLSRLFENDYLLIVEDHICTSLLERD